MFKKVLVAEDMDSVNHAVASVLSDLNIQEVAHAQYCDKAYILAKKALQENDPFDLLICDLSFKPDHRDEKITSGQDLIKKLKAEDEELRILVHSIEDHPQTVLNLFKSGSVNGYVCKDRNGMTELKEAIIALGSGVNYKSPRIEALLKQDNLLILNDFEVNLLSCIANGLTQDEIPEYFRTRNISPSSKSSIEKRLKELREEFNANTTPHLISIVKDLKLI